MDFDGLFKKYRAQIIIGLGILLFVGVALLLLSLTRQEPTSVEIISEQKELNKATIFVDIEGGIQHPGLYELPADSRINDLLVRAGGLSGEADREWTTQNLNLAEELTDGRKLYIPLKTSVKPSQLGGGGMVAGATAKINLNTASLSELDTLWGVGEKRAQDIVAKRPYQAVEDLLNRKIIPLSVYEKIKEQVTVN